MPHASQPSPRLLDGEGREFQPRRICYCRKRKNPALPLLRIARGPGAFLGHKETIRSALRLHPYGRSAAAQAGPNLGLALSTAWVGSQHDHCEENMTSPRPMPTGDETVVHSCWNGRVAGRYSQDGYAIVWVRGEIDIATAPDLMKELAESVRAQQCRVVVDLTDVTFMDSTGLNVLVLARSWANAGSGEVRLVGASGMLRKVLRITGLDQIFPVHSTIEESIVPRCNTTAQPSIARRKPSSGVEFPQSSQAESLC